MLPHVFETVNACLGLQDTLLPVSGYPLNALTFAAMLTILHISVRQCNTHGWDGCQPLLSAYQQRFTAIPIMNIDFLWC